jgi:hypothetical protein
VATSVSPVASSVSEVAGGASALGSVLASAILLDVVSGCVGMFFALGRVCDDRKGL